MPKETIIRFTVKGTGVFPIDMLRYDRCWPCKEGTDVIGIAASFDRRAGNMKWEINLQGLQNPTVARWESFGWKIS